ncbi:MAG: Mrp/NBP35 family ATP-binding protein, partial [Verrucomicrobiae bacterium]|nr:Mrp/NBP35 family ATP-binding protein [Verrucomicrobiae bacterium]
APDGRGNLVSAGLVSEIAITDGTVMFALETDPRHVKTMEVLRGAVEKAVLAIPGVSRAVIALTSERAQPREPGPKAQAAARSIAVPGIRHIVAVASGKGGVGKSTVAANLAVALAKRGARVGLCDCDLYGPSVAQMFGSNERPLANERDEILPIEAHGIQLMSMGFLLEDSSPVIVRGPMATRYTQQFLRQVAWDDLDYLVLDLPPGTGDIQLTIVQTVAVDGAVIVTTPQEVALIDARKAVSMFGKVNVPILGLIENMAWFECDHGERYFLFGEGGGVREAERLGAPLLGRIPIDVATRRGGDEGSPVALLPATENAVSAAFQETAAKIAASVPA